jgi:hypothetical protein
MRTNKILIFPLVLAAFVSCQKDIPYDFDKAEDKVVMNAQLYASEDTHAVYLSISTSQSIEKIRSGSVKCYINGTLSAEAQLDTSKDDDSFIRHEALYDYDAVGAEPSMARQTRFVFEANFQPGDIVRLECTANDGKYSAYSEAVVPQPPVFQAVDTSRYYNGDENSNFYHEWAYKIRLKGKDMPGERTYFRLTCEYEKRITPEYDDGETHEDQEAYEAGNLEVESGKDPILLDGAAESDMDMSGASENTYNAFSDYLFMDGTFDLTYQVREYSFLSEGSYEYSEGCKRIRIVSKVYPILWGITEDEYNFLKALGLYVYNGDDIAFTGPISIPSNVEGGLGMVSIATPSRDTIVFNRMIPVFDF